MSWYALRFWIELGFKAVKSLGWKWDKTRRTDPDPRLPPLAGAVGGYPAGPGLRHQGGGRHSTAASPRATCVRRPRRSGCQSPGPSEPSGARRQRVPPRRRLAEAACCSRAGLWTPGLAAARTLAHTQAQPGNYLPRAPLKTRHIPLSAP